MGSDFVDKLAAATSLGGNTPCIDTIGTITIAENTNVALASVAARLGKEAACKEGLKSVLGSLPPGPGKAQLNDPIAGFWTGPDQWMLGAPMATHEMFADQLKETFGDAASLTEQSGAWVVFDVTGDKLADLCERLCNVPIRKMVAGDVQRTQIHQLGCFVIRRKDAKHIRILGPRASAMSLHHSLITAAHSIA
jgi:sarcosine oxidase subunit gamma